MYFRTKAMEKIDGHCNGDVSDLKFRLLNLIRGCIMYNQLVIAIHPTIFDFG